MRSLLAAVSQRSGLLGNNILLGNCAAPVNVVVNTTWKDVAVDQDSRMTGFTVREETDKYETMTVPDGTNPVRIHTTKRPRCRQPGVRQPLEAPNGGPHGGGWKDPVLLKETASSDPQYSRNRKNPREIF